MESTSYFSPALRQHRFLAATLVCAAFLAAWFLVTDAADYLTVTPENFTPYYWPRRIGLLLHLPGGACALTVGLVRLWLGSAGRTCRLHRYLGRVYLLSVLVGSVGAFYMAATMPPPIGAYGFGLIGLGIAWVLTTSLAYVSICRGALAQHRAWVVRSYVVTFGFVVFRIINSTLATLGVGTEDSQLEGCMRWNRPPLSVAPVSTHQGML